MKRFTHLLDSAGLWAGLSFLVPLFVYLLTLAPSVTFFDSGEFLTAIYSMGSAHSPGYPLFINYARPFLFLPFGSIAFRINFATAFSGGLACFGAYQLILYLLQQETASRDPFADRVLKRSAALAGSLAFAFSARLWLQSNHDKPYPLVAFIAGVVFWLILRWREKFLEGDEQPAYVYAGAFLCGLAFGAHQTMILMVPVYATLLISTDWRLLTRVKELLLAVAFALAGFAIHLHLIIRATKNPLLNWGDPKSLSQFLWHLLRRGYPVEKPPRDLTLLKAQINAFNVPHEFTIAGLFFLFVGGLYLYSRHRHVIVSYVFGIVSFLLVIVGYFNTPMDLIFLTEEFFTPLYLFSAVVIGVGLFALIRYPAEWISARSSSAVALMTTIPLLLTFPAVVCALHYVENDQHENYIAHDYAANTMRSLPKGSVLYTWGDSGAFPLWYLQGVERMREDLDLLHTPHLVFLWYLDAFPHVFRTSRLLFAPLEELPPETALLMSMDEQIDKRPVFVDFSTRYSVPLGGYDLRQYGITYQISKGTGNTLAPARDIWTKYSFRGTSGSMFFRDLDTSKAILIYGSSHLEAGEALLRLGNRMEAILELRQAVSISPDLAGQANQVLAPYGLRLW